jgi:hypothetical protein
VSRAGLAVAGLALVLAGLTGTARAAGDGGAWAAGVTARLGSITVSATALRPGPAGTLTARMRVTTSGQHADELDAAIAADGAPVAVYHEWVSAATLSDLTDCGGEVTPPTVVQRWLHYGPLPVPGRSGGQLMPADATVTVQQAASPPAGRTLAITLYFASAGALVLRLPVAGG